MFGLKKYDVQLIELFSPTMPATGRRYSHVSVSCVLPFIDIRFRSWFEALIVQLYPLT
jgi:hypothetical protein